MHVRILAIAGLAVALLGACISAPIPRVPAVPFEATEAVFEGFAALQARPERIDEARSALTRASVLAPNWIAPRRLLDEIARARLMGVEVLREHREALARDPSDAGRLYLAGRLEGKAGRKRFVDAVHYDPALAWGWHGLSFAAAADGEPKAAVLHAREALARALDPYERTYFTTTLARQLAGAGESDKALRLLESVGLQKNVTERERTQLQVTFVEIGLEGVGNRTRERAYEKGLEILRERDLHDADIEALVPRMKSGLYLDDIDGAQLALALAARTSTVRERLRAEIAPSPISRALLERAALREGRPYRGGARSRAAGFAAFEFAPTVERWRASLPSAVVSGDGMPLDPRLARIVLSARALPSTIDPSAAASLVDFGDALIAAGWFKEARSVATKLVSLDLDRAVGLDNRAQAGLTILTGLERIARRSDDRMIIGSTSDRKTSEASRPVRSLVDFLDALVPHFARAHVFLGGEADVARLRQTVSASPRMSYAGVAELVHPGPLFSEGDERDDIGIAGEKVGGLAQLFHQIGRFAIFGQVVGGGGADASVLPVLHFEQRSGAHLGVPWRGTVAWCEGADLKSRAGRHGAIISAAALHEGYWVDVDAVRDEHAGWIALRRRFSLENGVSAADLKAILASGGLELPAQPDENERRSSIALLGEANRVRLAVLADRANAAGELGEVTLDELLAVTTTHEEGHLCDRTRFLPLFDHKLAILRFFAQCNFSPQRVGEELEYRAQLTALCASADPRIALAQVIDAAEGTTTSSLTPHSAGYKRLFDDFVRVLDKRASEFDRVDRGASLAHQLHALSGADVRSLAMNLARTRGLQAHP